MDFRWDPGGSVLRRSSSREKEIEFYRLYGGLELVADCGSIPLFVSLRESASAGLSGQAKGKA